MHATLSGLDVKVVRRKVFTQTEIPIVDSTFQKRKVHAWLVANPLWEDLLEMQ